MDIQSAKDNIKDAIRSYLDKDPAGNYVIPRNRQRPIMLIGAPGLGKTAIMSQIAAELDIGYVGYTITHHTRQSAIGLPMIETREYGGVKHPITRYTMSEIVASVYEAMESQDRREGILFIDEVNCVSETLSAAMLDLLQNKKFGPHPIPPGWVLVAAGNPPEFNSSAREFDIATLDRIRVIEVEPDTDVWLRYAMSAGIHDAITYYLQIKPQNLLRIENTPDGPVFVTPRGWEDLSMVLREHERLGLDTDVDLISQYVRYPEIAAEFKHYMDFHRKYSEDHDVDAILEGRTRNVSKVAEAGAEEKISLVSVIIGRLNAEAEEGMDLLDLGRRLDSVPSDGLEAVRNDLRRILDGNQTSDARRTAAYCLSALSDTDDADAAREGCSRALEDVRRRFDSHLENAMSFMISAFGQGQEPVSLLAGLIGCYSVVMFSETDGPLYRYNEELLTSGRDRRLVEMTEGLRWRTRSTSSPAQAAAA